MRKQLFINLIISLLLGLVMIFPTLTTPGGRRGRFTNDFSADLDVNSLGNILIIFLFYVGLIFILNVINTTLLDNNKHGKKVYLYRIIATIVVGYLLFQFAPVLRRGELLFGSFSIFRAPVLLRFSIIIIMPVLWGIICDLITKQHDSRYQIEHLRAENLKTKYNLLLNQINPHFFFNSLHAISAMAREQHNDNIVRYVDSLSDSFRYILRTSENKLTNLKEEVDFVLAYSHIFETRYGDKIKFTIRIDEDHYEHKLPVMSLQPLIENCIKHNTIRKGEVFDIQILSNKDEKSITIINPIKPKMGAVESNQLGLVNLSERYKLLTNKDITVEKSKAYFKVTLPLIKESKI